MSETSPNTSLPLVTVVVPVYNKRKTLHRTLSSVQKQTVSNLECICVDDGSTDGSVDVARDFCAFDTRFRVIQKKNEGVAIARNTGVFAGSGVYVCCLDSDDAIEPQFLEACVNDLEKDVSLGIAYTGLWYIKPNGEEGLSPWPGEFDYDKQLQGQNQIPTCNVSRREVWDRTGGQRQRYAPAGAGEEDAEFWLRACAYGWGAKKVTDAGLFIYSWQSGIVSGSKTHQITDWRAWHPFVKDSQHPFASQAKPKRFSHLVRQYDEPIISVIIPVGDKHAETLITTLDSIESQTFRKWEVVVVWDRTDEIPESLKKAYPYVEWVNYDGVCGAGYARNRGVERSSAPYLLFLDADDWLHPDALEDLYLVSSSGNVIAYSDYIGKVNVDHDSALASYGERLVYYDEKYQEASIHFNSANYDCEKACRQPMPDKGGYPYVWCLVTALTKRKWHEDIGGFDENMDSWEDWDYWIRIAKSGKCFTRVQKELVFYRFYSGSRRDAGLHAAPNLIQYLEKKYEGIRSMPCNCGNRNTVKPMSNATRVSQAQTLSSQEKTMSDSDMVLCLYDSPNRGDHRVIGPTTRTDYGYRNGGSRFYVYKQDIAAQPDLFKPIKIEQESVEKEVEDTPPPVRVESAPVVEQPISEPITEQPTSVEDDFQTIPGISAIHTQMLNAAGVHTFDELIAFGADNLVKLKGIGEKRAELVIEFARKKVANEL